MKIVKTLFVCESATALEKLLTRVIRTGITGKKIQLTTTHLKEHKLTETTVYTIHSWGCEVSSKSQMVNFKFETDPFNLCECTLS